MELPSYFSRFLSEIRLTEAQVKSCQAGHSTLRERLLNDAKLSKIIVNTFLQGSYRRATAVRPKGESRADVDVIIVTKLDQNEYTPARALEQFVPFLDRYYKDKYKRQGRSFGIELTYVDLDVVPTAAPSESEIGVLKEAAVSGDETPEFASASRGLPSWLVLNEGRGLRFSKVFLGQARQQAEWKAEPLLIPDMEAQRWTPTHPLEQIRWTWEKNSACSGHYVNVVKAIKWWRRLNDVPKYPKGYPVEHLIGLNCPDGIETVADGIVQTLENIVQQYAAYARLKVTPSLPDHGVPSHDVFRRVSGEDFAAFYALVVDAAAKARAAFDAATTAESATKWRALFGNKFPDASQSEAASVAAVPAISRAGSFPAAVAQARGSQEPPQTQVGFGQ